MAKKDEGYLLDGDGNPIRSESGEAVRTGSYDDEKVTQNRRKAAEDKLAEDVQKKLKADADAEREAAEKKAVEKKAVEKKAVEKKSTLSNDGDVSPYDRRTEIAASGPQRPRPARPGQSSSGRKPTADKPSQYKNDSKQQKETFLKEIDKTPKPAGASGLLDPQQKAQPSKSAASNKKPPPFEMPITKFFRGLRERGDADLKSRGMKAGGSVKMAKGKSINGIAKRGLTNCKMR